MKKTASRCRKRYQEIYTPVLVLVALFSALGLSRHAAAMDSARVESGADAAIAQYDLSGSGVTIVILDRGIDYTHPDFIKPDGTTRIRGILDMSSQTNWCNGIVPPPTEYTEAQINAALDGTGPSLATRDAVGHGTVTAGIAAGNGSAFANGKYRGIAPEADFLIVKFTSEGAPSRGGEPAESPFIGCFDDALDWVDQKLIELGQPAVALANWGTQFGPMDGTSALSRKIDEVFPPDGEGRIWVEGSGDEGDKDNHAGGSYQNATETVIPFTITAAGTYRMTLWYDGELPAEISVSLDDGTLVGPIGPGQSVNQSGIFAVQYTPGNEFYPWISTSGDRSVLIDVSNHIGTGEIRIRAQSAGTGRFDAYGSFTDNLVFTNLLVPGRIVDIAATNSAIVLGAYVNKNSYIDQNGVLRDVSNEGMSDEAWDGSSGGPTRDGRSPGVDVMTPGHNVIAAYGSVNTNFGSSPGNLVQDGGGFYGRQGAVSGAAPILLGAVALLLEMDPTLTTDRLRTILHQTATADAFTGAVPNNQWGYGKLNILAAADEVAAQLANVDTDGDGVPDQDDAFPNDPDETTDTDGDGIGNNADTDDDGDGVPDSEDEYPVGRFDDAGPGYWAFLFIEALQRAGITNGCGGDNYCPLDPVTRAQMSVFLERGMRGSSYSPPPATGNVFLDVAANSFAAAFIEQLAADGITGGCGGGNYCPTNPVTRAQMAVFLLRAKYGPAYSPPQATGIFGDVPQSNFAIDWIEQLAAESITSGCGGSNYCPDDPVTRAQMAVFLVRTFEL